jgi:5'-methylthioadenosine phosphorylase
MIGVIGGSGFEDALFEIDWDMVQTNPVTTPYGDVQMTHLTMQDGSAEIVFVARHGKGHSLAPHNINHRANLSALAGAGVKTLVTTSAVGALRSVFNPGDILVVSDFIDLRGGRPTTLFDSDKVVHTDFSDPFSHKVRLLATSALNEAIAHKTSMRHGAGTCVYPEGTYICVNGPRYETPAEVRWFASMGGDVVGMTVAPEAILARELGLEYASISVITNLATGLSSTPLSHEEVLEIMSEARPSVVDAIVAVAGSSIV